MGPPKGHKGISRKLSENPDHILFVPITKDPDTEEQVNSNSNSYQSHQILEIEPIKFIVIEIQRQTTTVNGRTVTAPNPKCMAHALRHIIYAIECEKEKGEYAKKIKDVIVDAIILKKEINFETNKYKKKRQELENKLDALLSNDIDTITNEGKKIWKLFRKYREHIFKFLYIKELPPDNNGSERDIREIVRSRKISKAYKTEKGLKNLAQIKSIVLTKRKRNENVFSFYQSVFGELILDTR